MRNKVIPVKASSSGGKVVKLKPKSTTDVLTQKESKKKDNTTNPLSPDKKKEKAGSTGSIQVVEAKVAVGVNSKTSDCTVAEACTTKPKKRTYKKRPSPPWQWPSPKDYLFEDHEYLGQPSEFLPLPEVKSECKTCGASMTTLKCSSCGRSHMQTMPAFRTIPGGL